MLDAQTRTNPAHTKVLCEPWDRLSVASLCASAAATNPSGLFIVDCPDRLAWNGAEPRSLSFDEFNRRARFLAAQLLTMGFAAGERMMILMPNSVDAAVAIVGCMIARLVPAIAPVDETVEALRAFADHADLHGILTTDRVEDIDLGDKARLVAAKALNIRLVGGFGENLPAGITPFDGWSTEDVDPLPDSLGRRQSAETLITFGMEGDAVCPHIRTEAQIIADALALATRGRLARGDSLISIVSPGREITLVAGLLLPMFVGATVRLVGPFLSKRLFDAIAAADAAVVLAPVRFLADLAAEARHDPRLARIVAAIGFADAVAGESIAALPPAFAHATLCLDLDGRGMLIPAEWSDIRISALAGDHAHPMPQVLPEGEWLISLQAEAGDACRVSGFGAAATLIAPEAPSEAVVAA